MTELTRIDFRISGKPIPAGFMCDRVGCGDRIVLALVDDLLDAQVLALQELIAAEWTVWGFVRRKHWSTERRHYCGVHGPRRGSRMGDVTSCARRELEVLRAHRQARGRARAVSA